jgi:3-keto-5-aminohexanoate cleavage enzyme
MSDKWPYLWNYANAHAFMENVRAGMPPLIICAACNGGVQGKEYNENLPETADEIADSVYDAYKAGATLLHIHARDPEHPSSGARRAEIWYEVNRKVRERCPDIIINNTTGGSMDMTMEEWLSCLDANPEMASLNLVPDMSKFAMKEHKAPLPDSHAAYELNREIATPAKARRMLGVSKTPSEYP